MSESTLNQEKLEAQRKYCAEKKYPFFVPNNGVCWGCHKNIMAALSLSACKNTLITGCPYCHKSYCD